jgi:L-fucose mutarotase
MLKTKLVHPEILFALGRAGHGARVLIADGDYPVSTTAGMNSEIVHLNLAPGIVNCTQVLEAILSILLIEDAAVMDVPVGQADPLIWTEYTKMFKQNDYTFSLKKFERTAFYSKVATPDTALVIQTGEIREYANLLLTIGSL